MNESVNEHEIDPFETVRNAAVKVLPEEQVDQVADRMRVLDQRARAFVRQYPVTTVLGAVAFGFVIGRVLRG